RLVVEPQLAVPTGVAQVALQAYAVLEQVLLAEVDGLVAGPALAFRLVHGDIGVVEEVLRHARGGAGEGDADAGRGFHLADRQDERWSESGADPSRDRVGV